MKAIDIQEYKQMFNLLNINALNIMQNVYKSFVTY